MGFSPSFFVLPFVLIHDARLAFRTLDSFNLGNRGTSCNVVALLDVSESIFVYLAANRKTPFGHWRNSNILYYFCQTTPLLSSKENWNTAIENPPKSPTFDHLEILPFSLLIVFLLFLLSWTNNRFFTLSSSSFACLMRQKRRANATKVRDLLTNGFDRKSILSLCFLSTVPVYSINQKWDGHLMMNQRVLHRMFMKNMTVSLTSMFGLSDTCQTSNVAIDSFL